MDREDFMDIVYSELHSDGDNNRANRIIDAADEYAAAQPEPHYDEWCDSCKEYDKEKHCCPRWNKVIKSTIEELKTVQPEPCEDAISRSWLLAEYDRQHQGPPGGARKIIETAPPVTPKQAETECCADCKYDGYGRMGECAGCCYSYASHFAHK